MGTQKTHRPKAHQILAPGVVASTGCARSPVHRTGNPNQTVLPASRHRAQAQVHVFGIGKIPLIEQPNLLKALTPREQHATRNIVHRAGLAPGGPIRFPLPEKLRKIWMKAHSSPCRPKTRGLSGHNDPRPQEPGGSPLRPSIDQLLNAIGIQQGVVVEEQHKARPLLQGLACSLIRGNPIAEVARVDQNLQVAKARLYEFK